MPVSIKTDIEWFSTWYIKTDPYQEEHSLVGILVEPTDDPKKNRLKFLLSYCGKTVEVLPGECSQEPDPLKKLANGEDEED